MLIIDKTASSTLILICRQVSDAAWYCWSLKRAMAANQVCFGLEEDDFIGSGSLYDEMIIMIWQQSRPGHHFGDSQNQMPD